jgi:hypothetical protein
LCGTYAVRETAPNGTALPGAPLTLNWPPEYSMSPGDASSRCAAIRLPFSMTLLSDMRIAVPPTDAERLP